MTNEDADGTSAPQKPMLAIARRLLGEAIKELSELSLKSGWPSLGPDLARLVDAELGAFSKAYPRLEVGLQIPTPFLANYLNSTNMPIPAPRIAASGPRLRGDSTVLAEPQDEEKPEDPEAPIGQAARMLWNQLAELRANNPVEHELRCVTIDGTHFRVLRVGQTSVGTPYLAGIDDSGNPRIHLLFGSSPSLDLILVERGQSYRNEDAE